jgi:hypothetical protein
MAKIYNRHPQASSISPVRMLKTGKKKEEIITVDFKEIDAIRRRVKELVKEHRFKIRRREYPTRGHYDNSYFYIGRGITNLVFQNLYVPEFKMRRVVQDLVSEFSCGFYVEGRSLYCYLRGVRKK